MASTSHGWYLALGSLPSAIFCFTTKEKELFTKKFWKDLAERSVRTFMQGAASYLTLMGLDLIQADLKSALIGGAAAGGYAVLTALVAHFKNPEQQSASLLDQPVATEPGRHDGSQAPYNAKLEGYANAPGVEPDVPVRSPLPPSEPPSDLPPNLFRSGQESPGVSFPPPLRPSPEELQAQHLLAPRQRDPQTGRFLPRNQGDI